MNETVADETTQQNAGEATPEDRDELLRRFVGFNAAYYRREFTKIGDTTGWAWSFNLVAALLGPIWFGLRGLWKWGLPFVICETLALTQILRGLFGDLSVEARRRIEGIEGTLRLRYEQLQAASDAGNDKVATIQNWIAALEGEIGNIRLEIKAAEESAIWVAAFGFGLLLAVKVVQGFVANWALEKRFSEWLSDRALKSGVAPLSVLLSGAFVLFVYLVGALFYGLGDPTKLLGEFPHRPGLSPRRDRMDRHLFRVADRLRRRRFLYGLVWHPHLFRPIGSVVRGHAMAHRRRLHRAANRTHRRHARRHFRRRLARLYGRAGVLGKSHDHPRPARHRGLHQHQHRHSARCFLRPPRAILRRHPPDYGLHANHAIVRFHDPGHRAFQRRQTRRHRHHHDFRRHAGGAINRARLARRPRIDPRSRHRFRRE